MKALSIRQPWAWMIVHGWKDVENRDWPTRVRGRILVHASKGMTRDEYDEAVAVARGVPGLDMGKLPTFGAIERGGIIGSVEIVDCCTGLSNPWFFGRYGFILRNPKVLPFRPYRGQLGFFEVQI
jgi:hypothetical protein